MSWFKEFKLLLWKNFLLAKRKPISTAFEILLPILFVFILLLLRITKIESEKEPKIIWPSFALDSNIPLLSTNKWIIAFTPNTSYEKLMQNVPKYLDVKVQGYESETRMVDDIVTDNEKPVHQQKYLCGVVFESSLSDEKIKYRLRFPSKPRNSTKKDRSFFSGSWFTAFVYPLTFQGLGPRNNKSEYGGPPSYFKEGFVHAQRAIDFAIIAHHNASFKGSEVQISMERFPYPAKVKDPFIIVIQNSLPLLLMLSLVYTAILIVRNIVYEKEKKLKESMKMMGLSNWLHWFAWFTKCFVFLLIPMTIITILLCVNFGGKGKMLTASHWSLIFIFLVLFSIATIMFCFFVSTLFYRANIASAGGGILWFLSYIPYFFLFTYYDKMSNGSKLAVCLDFNIAMAFGANLIGRFEGQGAGVQWSNLTKGVTVDETFTFGHVLLMLVFDSLFYGLLTWYIEGILPGEYGIPKKWYFPFSKKYWCSIQETEDESLPLVNDGFDGIEEDQNAGVQPDKDHIENVQEGLKPGIKIINLTKVFKTETGKNVAVDHLNLNFYEGQITALLGHNGAGKTTTISMLTGLFPPTSGNAVINGYDILYNMGGIRKSLGICPQHNVLFDNLTVEEHLWFFSMLKGVNDEKLIKNEVDRMVESIGLADKKFVMSKNLSGGMKRKLSVGIALVGDSKIVMLDEPTSGMDVSARRFTWDLLQRERQGRTIILTTHYMDEADVLGDRIAIMASGQVRCCGSSLFLKKKYGVGYHMVMVKDGSKCNVKKVTDIIQSYVPTAQLESNIGLELSIILPSDYSSQFEKLFTEIENRQDELGILSYGASVTTLEEVFIKVGEESEAIQDTTHQKIFRQLSGKEQPSRFVPEPHDSSPPPSPTSSQPSLANLVGDDSNISFMKNTGVKLQMQRWYAMFIKKLLHSKRHKASLISQLVMPCIFVLIALIEVQIMPKATDSPTRVLDLNMFGGCFVPYLIKGNSSLLTSLPKSLEEELHRTNAKGIKVSPSGSMTDYLIQKETEDLAIFNLKNPVALQMVQENRALAMDVTAWFNNEAYHTSPVAINTLSNALLISYTQETSFRITTSIDPLPATAAESVDNLGINPNGFQIGFSLCFGMAFLASSFIVFLVQERSMKAKHVQFVSGVDPISYWTSAYLWDLINFMLPTILIIVLFLIFQENAYTGPRLGYVFVLLVLYGWAIIPLMYIFSFFFEVASTAFTRMTILNVITGLATLLVVFILNIPSLDLLSTANALKWVFLVLPNYNLGQGMIDLFNNYNTIDIYNQLRDRFIDQCEQTGYPESMCETLFKKFIKESSMQLDFQTNYLAWQNPGIGRYLVFLAAEGFVFFSFVLMIEYRILPSLWYRLKNRSRTSLVQHRHDDSTADAMLDSDVVEEKQRIKNGYRSNDVLVMKDLTKVFGNPLGTQLVAVDHLSLGIPHGECFGLLGQNGAGKTTTFKMLTGDESISQGSAFIDSFNVSSDLGKVRQRMGYCPQFDALIDLMTGRELLTMYSRLRGVPERCIPQLVEQLSIDLTVDSHIDKVSKTYSGGNKRKLSTAIALAGDPPLIFLDEPSSGMDPVARRSLWDSLSKFIALGKSVVITSHSMDECEALCTRLAIMVNGQFKCLGSPQHLKTKFGEGYTLIARVGGLNPDTTNLRQFVETTFSGSTLKDEHQGYVHYQLKDDTKSWANLFGIMERAKEEYNIEDYSVSQTTLEQVFMNFARYQRVDEDE